jgi:flavin-dependent dehydrogenase
VAGADSDVVVVGAGPAGAATALLLARSGHRVTVVDRGRFPRDKACGEGLMPSGVGALRRLGVLDTVLTSGAPLLRTVTYRMAEPGGPSATAPFPTPPGGVQEWGLGVRRLRFDAVLAGALRDEPGVRFVEDACARGLHRDRCGRVIGLITEQATVEARLVVAADGLHSPMRAAAGWTTATRGGARYGLAGHWRTDTRRRTGITVSFGTGHEWYQAPVGAEELLVSVLGDRRRIGAIGRDYPMAARAALPDLAGAVQLGRPLAAGLFRQRPRRIAGDGLFLVGDAAGYDDPTTGEGIAVALLMAELLAAQIHSLLRGDTSPGAAAAAYTRAHRRLWRDRRRLTRLALAMAAHPRTSRRALGRLEGHPQTLEALLGINCGYWGFGRLSPRDWLRLAGR